MSDFPLETLASFLAFLSVKLAGVVSGVQFKPFMFLCVRNSVVICVCWDCRRCCEICLACVWEAKLRNLKISRCVFFPTSFFFSVREKFNEEFFGCKMFPVLVAEQHECRVFRKCGCAGPQIPQALAQHQLRTATDTYTDFGSPRNNYEYMQMLNPSQVQSLLTRKLDVSTFQSNDTFCSRKTEI